MGLHLKEFCHVEEFLRQPLTWNPCIKLLNGKMLGTRIKLAWGPFAVGPGLSILEWEAFSCHAQQHKVEVI